MNNDPIRGRLSAWQKFREQMASSPDFNESLQLMGQSLMSTPDFGQAMASGFQNIRAMKENKAREQMIRQQMEAQALAEASRHEERMDWKKEGRKITTEKDTRDHNRLLDRDKIDAEAARVAAARLASNDKFNQGIKLNTMSLREQALEQRIASAATAGEAASIQKQLLDLRLAEAKDPFKGVGAEERAIASNLVAGGNGPLTSSGAIEKAYDVTRNKRTATQSTRLPPENKLKLEALKAELGAVSLSGATEEGLQHKLDILQKALSLPEYQFLREDVNLLREVATNPSAPVVVSKSEAEINAFKEKLNKDTTLTGPQKRAKLEEFKNGG